MDLLIPVLSTTALVVCVYLLDKHTPLKKLPYMVRQVLIGLAFGAMAAYASGHGFAVMGTMANVRDAAPLSAGLIFGAPAGIISGIIGGLYRWFSVYWGAGTYTRLACTISTIFAGFMAAGLRRFLFDDKKAPWGYGVFITVVCEVIHMLMIFLTNMNDSAYAFEFVKGATIPMVLGNALSVGASILIVTLLSHEKLYRRKEKERIAQTFQRWLLVCILAAFSVTGGFTFILQNGMSKLNTESVILQELRDVHQDILDASDKNLLALTYEIRDAYRKEPDTPLGDFARQYAVTEINVVDENGIITDSTAGRFVGYDMSDGSQSMEFLCLLEGTKEYVQEYMRMSYNENLYRKYAGVRLPGGGFLQVGYDAVRFRKDINEFVVDATKNRHVGSSGFVAVCDPQMYLITDGQYNTASLKTIGIEIDPAVTPQNTILKTQVMGEPYLFAYISAEGYHIIGAMPEDEAMFMRDASLYTSIFMQVLIFATLFVFIYFLIKRVIINNLRRINDTLSQITDGNLNVKVNVRTNEEFASLSDDINSTVSTLKQYIAEAAARIDKELEYAKQIQLSALPSKFPPYPEQDRFDIYAQMIAAKEVGGDFYDFYMLDDDTVAFLAADVSGKGIPASLFMMTSKTILKDLAERKLPVNEIFTLANEKLCENNESGMFVTCWMGILDLRTGELEFANAGHNPPLLLRSGGEFEYLKTRAGFVLAGMEGVRYRMGRLTLNPGDRIFLYTDGVTEATDTAQTLYGEQRLLDYMNAHRTDRASTLLHGLKADIDGFVGEAPQFDDITMLMFDFGNGGSLMTERTFPAEVDSLPAVLAFAEEQLEQNNCSMRTQMAIAVALEEVFVNVAKYAYGEGGGEVKLEFGFDAATGTACLQMTDWGKPFDPLKRPDPDITLSAEEREIGGLGIFITKKTMDAVSYRYENANILTMYKKI